ncbi:DUF3159 domain-containing protein [Agrococcus sp. ARC_14]|uniref:DUF3159 domain-containing protein n=1 Tax=Agrococcus sp. ARC_14 TaxID=2919927 RepID=UPI001F05CC49|nr:DUF3159 domain-containing protein [Agrococcus sp. ARC_14]MCH1881640.1 DUF3159 domain-containing protein [Agrococcus sp. ARC_14]
MSAEAAGTVPTPDDTADDLVPAAFGDAGLGDSRFDADGDPTREESLSRLLGGGRAAIEGSIPPIAFLAAWIASGGELLTAVIWSLIASAATLVTALVQRRKPRAVFIGMLMTVLAAMVAYYTGEARNFFLIQLLSNAASALAWTISIVIGWPFLGLIVGGIIGTRLRWRKDPVLLRAYQRASWIWVLQYVIRVVVFSVLWWLDEETWLAIMRAALTYPLIIACVALSGWVLFSAIPKSHPGIRKPQVAVAD